MVHQDSDHGIKTQEKPVDSGTFIGDPYQVILYNDDHNTCEHVVKCLMEIFGHSAEMAKKIMTEAHQKGRTIAQVETQSRAVHHVALLQAAGLKAEVESIS